MTEAETMGQRIRRIRRQNEWSQEQLGRRVGMGQQSIWRLEHDKTDEPFFSTVDSLADALGVDPHWLYTGEGESTPKKAGAPQESGRLVDEGALKRLPTAVVAILRRLLKAKEDPTIDWHVHDILVVREEFARLGVTNQQFGEWFEVATIEDLEAEEVEEPQQREEASGSVVEVVRDLAQG